MRNERFVTGSEIWKRSSAIWNGPRSLWCWKSRRPPKAETRCGGIEAQQQYQQQQYWRMVCVSHGISMRCYIAALFFVAVALVTSVIGLVTILQ